MGATSNGSSAPLSRASKGEMTLCMKLWKNDSAVWSEAMRASPLPYITVSNVVYSTTQNNTIARFLTVRRFSQSLTSTANSAAMIHSGVVW